MRRAEKDPPGMVLQPKLLISRSRSARAFCLLNVSRERRAGFALVAVIWTLGLIVLLAAALIVGARYRARLSSDFTSLVQTERAAESAVNLAIVTALSAGPASDIKFPLSCQMPGGEQATISIEEENGKVDLNTATPAALARFFTALTRDQSKGLQIAARIQEFRDKARKPAPAADGKAPPPAAPAFTTIMQLDELSGLPAPLFRTALRFVTVRSGRNEPDLEAATPAMRQLLGADQNKPPQKRGLAAGASVTIRADINAPGGNRYMREALVTLAAENGRPFTIREWRHGDLLPAIDAMMANQARDIGRCVERSAAPSS
jgi:general secretion pathway protein K